MAIKENNLQTIRLKNERIYILRALAESGYTQLCSGGFITAFMISIGFGTQSISAINAVGNAGSILACIVLLYAFRWDKSGVRILKLCSAGGMISSLGFLIAGYAANYAFPILLVSSFLSVFLSSGRNGTEVDSAVSLFEPNRYSRLLGKSGIMSGSFAFAVSLLAMYLFRNMKGIDLYRSYFYVAFVFAVAYLIFTLGFKKADEIQNKADAVFSFKIKKLFSGKYLKLSIPHVARGIGSAGVSLTAALVLKTVKLTEFQSSLLVVVTIASVVLGSAVYLLLNRRFKSEQIIFVSFVLSIVCMLAAPFIKNAVLFFCDYVLLTMMTSISGKSVMTGITISFQGDELAMMSSIHILTYSLAFCPTVLVFGAMMDVNPLFVMGVASVFYMISGALFLSGFWKKVDKT